MEGVRRSILGKKSNSNSEMEIKMETEMETDKNTDIDTDTDTNAWLPELVRQAPESAVMAECPLIVMLLFQIYPALMPIVPEFIPLMMEYLLLKGEDKVSESESESKS